MSPNEFTTLDAQTAECALAKMDAREQGIEEWIDVALQDFFDGQGELSYEN